MAVEIPHFALPFRIVAGQAVVNEQNSPEEIRDCVAAIVSYTVGSRPERPNFGVEDETFEEGGADPAVYLAAVARFEPRADVHALADPSRLAAYLSSVNLDTAPRQEAGS